MVIALTSKDSPVRVKRRLREASGRVHSPPSLTGHSGANARRRGRGR